MSASSGATPATAAGSASPSGLTGTARVLAVLRCLAEHPAGMRVADVTEATRLPKSSAHRALAALVQADFARQDVDGTYHLGFDVLRLAFGYHEAQVPSRVVGRLLQRLAEETGETSHFGVLVDGAIIYQAKVSPRRHTFQMSSVIGGSNPAYRTGIGKALLMHELPDRVAVDRYVMTYGPLQAQTRHTLVSGAALHAALEEGRRRGYTLDLEENDLGIVCLAMPLFLDSPRRPSGAVSISAVASRTSADDLVALEPTIRRIVVDELGPGTLHPPLPTATAPRGERR